MQKKSVRNDYGEKQDKRKERSHNKIKEGFISLHAREGYNKVTVSALCKEAEVSRGTFYAHFKNVSEVLDEILDEALLGTGRFWARYLNIDDEDVSAECKNPFCVFVRENKKYQKIFTDDAFFSLIVKKLVDRSFEKYYAHISKHSDLSPQQLKAILGFQTSGCLSITKMSIKERTQKWTCIRGCIDKFVKAGIDSIFEKKY